MSRRLVSARDGGFDKGKGGVTVGKGTGDFTVGASHRSCDSRWMVCLISGRGPYVALGTSTARMMSAGHRCQWLEALHCTTA